MHRQGADAAVGETDAEVRSIAAAPDHRLLVLDIGGVAGWVQLPAVAGEVRHVALAPCTGPGGPAPDAMSLVCPSGARTIVQPIAWKADELDLDSPARAYLGQDAAELLVTDDDGIWAVSAADTEQRRLLAPHRPDEGLQVSPDGERAVGRYIEPSGDQVVYTFRLDGKAVQRKLGDSELPVAWSADSQWVLLAHERRACVVRGVGGEYKCWERYAAVGLSPDSAFVLLARDGGLYRASIAGVNSDRPKLIAKDAGTAAVWLPAQ